MDCQFRLVSSPLSSSSSSFSGFQPSSFPNPKFKTLQRYLKFSITSQFSNSKTDNADDVNDTSKKTQFDYLRLSVTLTVISASLLQPAFAQPSVKERKRTAKKPAAKKVEALSPQELKYWSQGLPVVSNRIPYTEVLELKVEGKLKHVVKPPGIDLKLGTEPVLVVLEDSRVLRAVLPSSESDRKFWENWAKLDIDSLCVNAYTPPVKRPEVPSPYLGVLARIPQFMFSFVKPKIESKKVAELRRTREEFKRQRKEELERMRDERVMLERTMKIQKKEEERRLKREMRKKQYTDSLREARKNYQSMANMWEDMAQNSNVTTALGLIFFYIFYRTVVLNYRKQKRDYEDRLKIQKAEAEERKKMRELEREEGIEGQDEDEIEEGKGEQNPYLKMATQFMKSGARVRRAQNKILPQYLERGVDVKFSDVAGLGKIRLELEEIVKFFTHAETYRKRGVKIPGIILLFYQQVVALVYSSILVI